MLTTRRCIVAFISQVGDATRGLEVRNSRGNAVVYDVNHLHLHFILLLDSAEFMKDPAVSPISAAFQLALATKLASFGKFLRVAQCLCMCSPYTVQSSALHSFFYVTCDIFGTILNSRRS